MKKLFSFYMFFHGISFCSEMPPVFGGSCKAASEQKLYQYFIEGNKTLSMKEFRSLLQARRDRRIHWKNQRPFDFLRHHAISQHRKNGLAKTIDAINSTLINSLLVDKLIQKEGYCFYFCLLIEERRLRRSLRKENRSAIKSKTVEK